MADVKLSHPDKVLFPDDGMTKADLAEYYASVAERDAPARARPAAEPVALEHRASAGRLVVQQDIPKGAPDWVQRVETPRRKGGSIEHVLCQDADTLRWLANQNCITPHVWTARRDRLDRPDRIVFDLDPEAGSDFALVREAALLVGERLREDGPGAVRDDHRLQGDPRRGAAQAHARGRRGCASGRGELGAEIAARSPDTLTTEWRKEKRDGQDPRRHGPQHLRADRRRALRRAGARRARRWRRRWRGRSCRTRSCPRARGRCAPWPSGSAEKGDPWADIAGHAGTLPG